MLLYAAVRIRPKCHSQERKEERNGAEEERRNGLAQKALAYLPLDHLSHVPLWPAKKSCIGQKCTILYTHVQEPSACRLGGGLCPKPLFELCLWATLGDFRPLLLTYSSPSCIKWQWVPLFSLRCGLLTMSAARQTPRGSRTRVRFLVLQEFGALQVTKSTDSWLSDTGKILVLICLYCLKCTKFDQVICRKIIKIVATRCQILRLKCTKFDFGWCSAPDPARELTALPQTP